MEVFICVFSICKPVYYAPNQVSNKVIWFLIKNFILTAASFWQPYTRMYRRSFGENFKLQTIGLKTHMLSVSFSLALQLALRRKEGIPDISRKFSFSMTHPDSWKVPCSEAGDHVSGLVFLNVVEDARGFGILELFFFIAYCKEWMY